MDECIVKGEEFLKALEEAGEKEHAEMVKGVIDDMKHDYEEEGEEEDDGELEEEEGKGPEENEDDGGEAGMEEGAEDKLDNFANEELKKKGIKPIAKITIGVGKKPKE